MRRLVAKPALAELAAVYERHARGGDISVADRRYVTGLLAAIMSGDDVRARFFDAGKRGAPSGSRPVIFVAAQVALAAEPLKAALSKVASAWGEKTDTVAKWEREGREAAADWIKRDGTMAVRLVVEWHRERHGRNSENSVRR